MDSRTSVKDTKAEVRRRKQPPTAVLDKLWEQYAATKDVEIRNQLVEAYMHIVQREARKIAGSLAQPVNIQELESAGILGLIDSFENFDPAQGFRFVTFCAPRVRGAMLDELRSWDWTPRATRAKLNKLDRTIRRLEGRFGRSPDTGELAGEMGLPEHEIRRLFSDRSRAMLSLNSPATAHDNDGGNIDTPITFLEDRREVDPARHLQKKEMIELVREMLTQNERVVVTLYYYERLKLREIALVLGLTESRVCQIHSELVQRLKRRLS